MLLDQFYTNDFIAKECFDILMEHLRELNVNCDIWLEPSAGKGSFYKLLPENKLGIDIEPKYQGIVQSDFFTYNFEDLHNVITIGNPPFGKQCSTAIKFFNHSSKFSNVIAFIIPRTFKRISVQNQLSMEFHLIFSKDIPLTPCAFTPKMNAKCCFQIWVKKPIKRQKIILPKTCQDFTFVKYGPKDNAGQPTVPHIDSYDFVIKSYGSNCGELLSKKDTFNLRPKSWAWIKSNIDIELLASRFKQLDYSISNDSCRQSSIGHQELIQLYNTFIEK